jgi:hypothetical protein
MSDRHRPPNVPQLHANQALHARYAVHARTFFRSDFVSIENRGLKIQLPNSLEEVRTLLGQRCSFDEMIIEDISVNEAVRARGDIAQHILLGQQIVLRRFSDFVSDCLVELDASSALLGDNANGLNRNSHALMLLERFNGF